jgi:hypothetical protein
VLMLLLMLLPMLLLFGLRRAEATPSYPLAIHRFAVLPGLTRGGEVRMRLVKV